MRRTLIVASRTLPALLLASALVVSCWAGSGLLVMLADKLLTLTVSLSAQSILSARLLVHAVLAGLLALTWHYQAVGRFSRSQLDRYALPSLTASAAASVAQAVFVAFPGFVTDLLRALPWAPIERAYFVSLVSYLALLALLLTTVWSRWGRRQAGPRTGIVAILSLTALVLLTALASPTSLLAALESVGMRAIVGGHLSFDPIGPLAISRAWVVVAPLAGALAFPNDRPAGVSCGPTHRDRL